jgi:hypothetical protein
MRQATKRFVAIGGVIIPIDVLTTIIIPSATGSIPNCSIIGINIGVNIRIIDPVSNSIPKNKRIIFIMKRIKILLLNTSIAKVEIISGMPLDVNSHENGAAKQTTNRMIDAFTADFIVSFLNFDQGKDLYTHLAMRKAYTQDIAAASVGVKTPV